MSIKLNDTQLVLLSTASQREDHGLVPPTGRKLGHAQKAVAKLLEAGLVKEIRAKTGAPIWRRDEGTGHSYMFKLTAAGVKTIAVDENPLPQTEAEPHGDQAGPAVDSRAEPGSNSPAVDRPDGVAARNRMAPRSGTKIAEVIELLQRSDGATVAELAVATSWLTHTTRAALTGLRKRGYAIAIDRTDKLRGSVYRIEPMETSSDSDARSGESTPTDKAPPDPTERAPSPRSRQAA
jgi:Protein of unknown function (DUF3489)